MLRSSLLAACAMLPLAGKAAQAQTVTSLKHPVPGGALIGFVLTDGRVLLQTGAESTWYTLTPDNTGSYVNGTLQQVGSLYSGYVPYAMASAVLADGRVVIAGGEYNNNEFAFTDLCAIFDPVKNTWSKLKPPKGWGFIGDSPSTVLPDGRFFSVENSTSGLRHLTLKRWNGRSFLLKAKKISMPKKAGR
jgi:hypothetical protein